MSREPNKQHFKVNSFIKRSIGQYAKHLSKTQEFRQNPIQKNSYLFSPYGKTIANLRYMNMKLFQERRILVLYNLEYTDFFYYSLRVYFSVLITEKNYSVYSSLYGICF